MGAQNSDPAQERRGTDRHLFGVGHGGLRMRTVRLPSVAGPPLAWSALAGYQEVDHGDDVCGRGSCRAVLQ